jgi:hypothetical protein
MPSASSECERILVHLQSPALGIFVIFILVTWVGVKRFHIVVLIGISPMTNEIEQFFHALLAICVCMPFICINRYYSRFHSFLLCLLNALLLSSVHDVAWAASSLLAAVWLALCIWHLLSSHSSTGKGLESVCGWKSSNSHMFLFSSLC